MKEIVIDPITRLEGHGNVSIFLNDKGDVENAYLKIPELRGFEQFCVGRRAELILGAVSFSPGENTVF